MNVCFVTSSRSDFGLIRPILKKLFHRTGTTIQLVCVGQAALMDPSALQEGIGPFSVHSLKPAALRDRAASSHQTVEELSFFATHFSGWLRAQISLPDWVFLPGDRFEIMGVALAAYYNNCPIAHIFGGDRSLGGHLDDNIRHALTKLAHLHFAVCQDSAQRILKMGEEPWRVHNVGSPVVESIQEIKEKADFQLSDLIEPHPFNILCTYNPITTESDQAGIQFTSILKAFQIVEKECDAAFIFTYPNNELGSQQIVEKLNKLPASRRYYVFRDLGWKKYLSTLLSCQLMVGNSSSGLLESPIAGVPSLDIGTRQRGRFAPNSVTRLEEYDSVKMAAVILDILRRKKPVTAHPYGTGKSSEVIGSILQAVTMERSRKEILQKQITY